MAERDPTGAIPYTDHAYVEASVDRLATVGLLSGWPSPPRMTARVLDLGCGRAGNLLPQAVQRPDAEFVGVDLDPAHIAEARAIVRAAGLGNVTLHETSLFDRPWREERFDFVTAHGVASWVSPTDRRRLFRVVEEALAPGGIAYVSANILPGWHLKRAARDWLRFIAAGGLAPRPAEQLAWLVQHVSPQLPLYRRSLEQVHERLRETDPAYALHEFLAEEHHPELVTTLLGEVEAAGLTYLGDACPGTTAVSLLAPEVAERALAEDGARGEQLIDFASGTAFRRMVLVRSLDAVARGWHRPRMLDYGAARGGCWLKRRRGAADAAPQIAGLPPEVERACAIVAAAWPRAVTHRDLARAVRLDEETLATELVDLWLVTDDIELRADEPLLSDAGQGHPAADPVARWHAEHGGSITNAWHHSVLLDHPTLSWVLARLDGTRTVDDLAALLRRDRPDAAISPGEAEAVVRASLRELEMLALLVAARGTP